MPAARTKGRGPMPQPARPQADEVTEAKAALTAEETAWRALVERASTGDGEGARQVRRAVALEAERARIMDVVAKNRTLLRLLDSQDSLDADQQEFLDTFYPEKERGTRRSAADVEATRKAKLVARRGGNED